MKMLKFPELRQTYEWDCGANALQSILVYYGMDIREEMLIKAANTKHYGTSTKGMQKAAKKYGLDFKAGKMSIDDVKHFIDKGIPVILLLQAWSKKKHPDYEKDWKDGHFVVAIGYDQKNIYFEDPADVVRTFLSNDELMKRWHEIDIDGIELINWGLAVSGKKANFDPKKNAHMD